jgi:hypothetical protein
MMTVKRLVAGVLLLVAFAVVAGCNKPAAGNPARLVAEDFYRSWYLNGSAERAWDLALPGVFGNLPWAATREAFLAAAEEDRKHPNPSALPVDAQLRITEYDRAGDWLYLVQDSRDGHLIWVTKTPQGWRVRKTMHYEEGMIIPWS